MPRSIGEYKEHLEENFTLLLMGEDWDNLVDNMIDYDGIEFPSEENTEAIEYQLLENRAWALRGEEERKAMVALREYLQEKIDAHASETMARRNDEEGGA